MLHIYVIKSVIILSEIPVNMKKGLNTPNTPETCFRVSYSSYLSDSSFGSFEESEEIISIPAITIITSASETIRTITSDCRLSSQTSSIECDSGTLEDVYLSCKSPAISYKSLSDNCGYIIENKQPCPQCILL